LVLASSIISVEYAVVTLGFWSPATYGAIFPTTDSKRRC
jgi:hypothetical protein